MWGGEIPDRRPRRRLAGSAHLRPLPLPGGEAAIREPWRLAVAALLDAGEALDLFEHVAPERAAGRWRGCSSAAAPSQRATGAGRWFDAVAALLGARAPTSATTGRRRSSSRRWRGAATTAVRARLRDRATGGARSSSICGRPSAAIARRPARARRCRGVVAARFHPTLAARDRRRPVAARASSGRPRPWRCPAAASRTAVSRSWRVAELERARLRGARCTERVPPQRRRPRARTGGGGVVSPRERTDGGAAMCLGIPGEVVERSASATACASASVRFGGVTREVCLDCLPEVVRRRLRARSRRLRDREDRSRERRGGLAGARGHRPDGGGPGPGPGGDGAVKYLDEYRDPDVAARRRSTRSRAPSRGPGCSWRSAAARRTRSSATASTACCRREVELVHGPGCPVCVTPLETIDRAHAIARAPGRHLHARSATCCACPARAAICCRCAARGADVRVVYSPLDARRARPRRTPTAGRASSPSASRRPRRRTRWRWSQARRRGVANFSHARLARAGAAGDRGDPAGARQPRAGVPRPGARLRRRSGYREYEALAARYRVPIVITGFEPVDLLEGILMAVRQLEEGRAEVENQYARAVARDGQPGRARSRSTRCSRSRPQVARHRHDPEERATGSATSTATHDAERLFEVEDDRRPREPAVCISGLVLRGLKKPGDCPAFGTRVHAAHAARRDDGLGGGRVRRLLPVRASVPSEARGMTALEASPISMLRKAQESAELEVALLRGARRAARGAARGRSRSGSSAGGRLLRDGQRRLGVRRRSTSRSSSCTRSSRSGARCRRSRWRSTRRSLTAVGNDARLRAGVRRASSSCSRAPATRCSASRRRAPRRT